MKKDDILVEEHISKRRKIDKEKDGGANTKDIDLEHGAPPKFNMFFIPEIKYCIKDEQTSGIINFFSENNYILYRAEDVVMDQWYTYLSVNAKNIDALYSYGFSSCIAIVVISNIGCALEHYSGVGNSSLFECAFCVYEDLLFKGARDLKVTFAFNYNGFEQNIQDTIRDCEIDRAQAIEAEGDPLKAFDKQLKEIRDASSNLKKKGICINEKILDLTNGAILVIKEGEIITDVPEPKNLETEYPSPKDGNLKTLTK